MAVHKNLDNRESPYVLPFLMWQKVIEKLVDRSIQEPVSNAPISLMHDIIIQCRMARRYQRDVILPWTEITFRMTEERDKSSEGEMLRWIIAEVSKGT